jgi:two-component system, OmpR family, KDP operon response regulator KdpE
MPDSGLRILVIDDEQAIRRVLRVALAGQGCTVFEAETGAQGLASAAADRPDVIVFDLGLPDLGGLDVIRQLREWTQTPIIVLSVRDREEVKVEALNAGADDYLTKPFGIGELLARIRVAWRRSLPPYSEASR